MNFKTTYILFGVLFAGLLLLAAVSYWGGGHGPAGEGDEYLFADFNRAKDPVKAEDVESVRVERSGDKKETILFVRDKSAWQMKEPHDLRVESQEVSNLVREVAGVQREKSEMS